MRGITPEFITALKAGELNFVLAKAQNEPKKYCLEIRENYINLYYRGGSVLKIIQKPKGYQFKFDHKYCLEAAEKSWFKALDQWDPDSWRQVQPRITIQMDHWFGVHPKAEREKQQQIMVANRKGFCIVDIEYAIHKKNLKGINGCRLDMLALHQTPAGAKLVLIEYKNGIGAMSGNASLAKHHADFLAITQNPAAFDELEKSVVNIWQNKYELGLLTIEPKPLIGTEVLFLISNHNPKSTKLDSQKTLMNPALPAKICFLKQGDFNIDYEKAERLI